MREIYFPWQSDFKNITVGDSALQNNTTGNNNIGLGYSTPQNNTIGSSNIAIGQSTPENNTVGNSNVGVGQHVLENNTVGNYNIGIAPYALEHNTTGNYNMGIGCSVLRNNVTGSNNIGIGYSTLQNNTTGINNIGMSLYALQNNTSGFNNVGIGSNVLKSNTIGNNNTVIGHNSLVNANGSDNVCIGNNVCNNSISNDKNTFIGSQSGTTGSNDIIGSVCIGYRAGNWSTNNYNAFIGYQAGWTGSNNGGTGLICIGANSYPSSTTTSNECTIFVGSDNNSSTARFSSMGTNWTFMSGGRDKTDIEIIHSGIDLINQIQPCKYKWDKREWYDDGVPDSSKKNENWYSGFIAQELEDVQNVNNAEYLNLVYKGNPDKLEIASNNLIPVIVKALQDLSKENKNSTSKLMNLSNQNNLL